MGVSRRRANKLGLLFFVSSLSISLFAALPAHALGLLQGYVEQGGVQLRNSGVFPILRSPTTALTNPYTQQSFPRASVDVYLLGTTTHVVLYPDAAGAQPPLPNPLTADTSGWFSCYVATGTYSVRFSGGGLLAPVTRTLTAGAITSVASSSSINVKDPPYSAVGDGVADDTTAISAAITAAANGPGALYFPPGVYIVSSQLKLGNILGSLAQTSVIFFGAGYHLSRIKSLVTGTSLFYLLNPSPALGCAFTFRDMSFQGRNTGFVAGEGCFHLESNTNAVIEHCEIYGFNGGAIGSNSGIGCQFIGNYIHDCWDEGVLTNGAAGSGNRVIGNTFIHIGTYAIDNNDSGTIIADNFIGDGGYGAGGSSTVCITVEGNDGQSPQNTVITNNVLMNNNTGGGIQVSVDTTVGSVFVHGVVISGNIIDGNNAGGNGHGIRLTTVAGAEGRLKDVSISGNTVKNQIQDGVYAYGVAGLSIDGGNAFNVTGYAIEADASCSNVKAGRKNVAISSAHPTQPYLVPPSSCQSEMADLSGIVLGSNTGVFTTANPAKMRYKLDGDELEVEYILAGCSLTLATSYMTVQFPAPIVAAGYVANGTSIDNLMYYNGGAGGNGVCLVSDGANVIILAKNLAATDTFAQDLANGSEFVFTAKIRVR